MAGKHNNKYWLYIKLAGAYGCGIILLLANVNKNEPQVASKVVVLPAIEAKEDTNTIIKLIASSQHNIALDSAKAMGLAEKSLQIAQKLNDKNFIARGYRQIGNVFTAYIRPDKALDYYRKAIDICNKEGYVMQLAILYNNVATQYDYIGDFKKSAEYYNKALAICRQYNNRKKEAGILSSMGDLFLKHEQYLECIDYQLKSLAIHEEVGNNIGVLNVLMSIATGYTELYKATGRDMANLDTALSYCEKGFAHLEKSFDLGADYHLVSDLYCRKAEALFLKKEYNAAINTVAGAIDAIHKTKDKSILYNTALCKGYLLLGKIQSEKGEGAKGLTSADRALLIAGETNDPALLSDCYNLQASICNRNGDWEKAYYFHDKLLKIKDELFTKDKITAINTLRIEHETAQKEWDIIKLKKEKTVIVVMAGAGFGILLLLLRSYRLRRRILMQEQKLLKEENQKIALENQVATEEKKKAELERQLQQEEKLRLQQEHENTVTLNNLKQEQLQAEIAFKNKELTSQVVLLEKKNDFLLQLKNDLNQTKRTGINFSSKEDGVLKNINKLIDQHLTHENDFEKFRLQFEQVYTGFFDKLSEKSEQRLSQLELRHCAYIKLNLNTNEIANLLNVAVRTIRIARYRIKQKLKLDKDTDLQSFVAML